MKITVAQVNTIPGDFRRNLELIKSGIDTAGSNASDVVLFPEMAVCGYLIRDAIYNKGFVRKNQESLDAICEWSRAYPTLTIVIGYVGKNFTGTSKPFTNMAAVIKNGSIVTTYQKRLLPYYDVFDEGRYFANGDKPCIIDINGSRCGIAICEDIWNDKDVDHYPYTQRPVEDYKDKIEYLLCLNASPFHRRKSVTRMKMLSNISKEMKCTVVYANQCGLQDELWFDGNSCVINGNDYLTGIDGYVLGDIKTVTWDSTEVKASYIGAVTVGNIDQAYGSLETPLVGGIKDYVHKTGFTDVVIGSSGGIDSAVVITLACKALGCNRVHAVMMPTKHSSAHSITDAELLHKNLGCNSYTIPIDFDTLLKHINTHADIDGEPYNPVADENIQSRLRGLTLMHMANANNWLMLNTGNKTELALGYVTLGGDTLGGFSPLGDLYKNQVYELAATLNKHYNIIPDNILKKAPSAELSPNQTDESSLNIQYPVLNCIVMTYLELFIDDFDTFCNWCLTDESFIIGYLPRNFISMWANDPNNRVIYENIITRIDSMEFKRKQMPPCIKVSKKAFGMGRRMPIINRRQF